MGETGQQVEILNEKNKKEMKWVGAVDPFDSVTIASVCMNVFRTKFIEEEWTVKLDGRSSWMPAKMIDQKLYVLWQNKWIHKTNLQGETVNEKTFVRTPIAKLPPSGYNDQYNKASIQWLELRARVDNVTIQHALNVGEKSIPGTRYKLDRYCEEKNMVYEYHGCVFHGCPVCFPDNRQDRYHPLTKQSLSELHALTRKKEASLENLGEIRLYLGSRVSRTKKPKR